MAYFNQEDKKKVAPAIKEVLKKYGCKGSISVRNHSTLVVTIKEGKLDFLGATQKVREYQARQQGRPCYDVGTYLQVNEYHASSNMRDIDENQIADFYDELVQAMKSADWFDKSDIMTDYHHTAYYIDINVGKWNKPYNFLG